MGLSWIIDPKTGKRRLLEYLDACKVLNVEPILTKKATTKKKEK